MTVEEIKKWLDELIEKVDALFDVQELNNKIYSYVLIGIGDKLQIPVRGVFDVAKVLGVEVYIIERPNHKKVYFNYKGRKFYELINEEQVL